MPEMARLILAALACYRLAQLITLDEGPFGVFERLRVWAGCYEYGPDGKPERSLGRLLSCPYCVGVWAAMACAALVMWPAMAGDWLLIVLGLAGAQAWLQGARHE